MISSNPRPNFRCVPVLANCDDVKLTTYNVLSPKLASTRNFPTVKPEALRRLTSTVVFELCITSSYKFYLQLRVSRWQKHYRSPPVTTISLCVCFHRVVNIILRSSNPRNWSCRTWRKMCGGSRFTSAWRRQLMKNASSHCKCLGEVWPLGNTG